MWRSRVVLGALLALVALVAAEAVGTASPVGAADRTGYWVLDANGTVYGFGGARHLGQRGGQLSIDIEATPSGTGYYVLQPDGTVWEYGDAALLPDPPPPADGDSWTAITSTRSGRGFWAFSARGCVAAIGDAVDHGSMCGRPLNAPVVGSAVTPGGNGYWVVARDGGVFSFGDARFHGSTGDMPLNAPVTGMAPAPTGNGYWLVAEDGGIFTFGPGLPFYGSMGGRPLNAPVVGIVTSPTGGGYLLVARDGGIFAFGDVPFDGSLGADPPAAPVVSVTPLPRPQGPTGQPEPEPEPEPGPDTDGDGFTDEAERAFGLPIDQPTSPDCWDWAQVAYDPDPFGQGRGGPTHLPVGRGPDGRDLSGMRFTGCYVGWQFQPSFEDIDATDTAWTAISHFDEGGSWTNTSFRGATIGTFNTQGATMQRLDLSGMEITRSWSWVISAVYDSTMRDAVMPNGHLGMTGFLGVDARGVDWTGTTVDESSTFQDTNFLGAELDGVRWRMLPQELAFSSVRCPSGALLVERGGPLDCGFEIEGWPKMVLSAPPPQPLALDARGDVVQVAPGQHCTADLDGHFAGTVHYTFEDRNRVAYMRCTHAPLEGEQPAQGYRWVRWF